MIKTLLDIINFSLILEFVAAVVATFSYIKIKKLKTQTFKFLSIYLWIVISVEVLGSYTFLICPYKFDELPFFINNPQFNKNYWLFNIYTALAYMFYTWYFFKQLISSKKKSIVIYSMITFNIITIFDFIFGEIFFIGYSQLMNLFGLILIVMVLCMYYYEILTSDRILEITHKLPFYISVGVLLYFISITPLFLSSQYIKSEEIVFTKYYRLILSYANYFLYGIIIFGIVKCYWFKKSQSTKFSSSPTLS